MNGAYSLPYFRVCFHEFSVIRVHFLSSTVLTQFSLLICFQKYCRNERAVFAYGYYFRLGQSKNFISKNSQFRKRLWLQIFAFFLEQLIVVSHYGVFYLNYPWHFWQMIKFFIKILPEFTQVFWTRQYENYRSLYCISACHRSWCADYWKPVTCYWKAAACCIFDSGILWVHEAWMQDPCCIVVNMSTLRKSQLVLRIISVGRNGFSVSCSNIAWYDVLSLR